MARRTRTRLPWPPERLRADASFFEDDSRRPPRPDSPEVSVFSPAEESESHRRWNRALLRERFTGPVSGAERLGLGISAASLAALANLDQHPNGDGRTAGQQRRGASGGTVNGGGGGATGGAGDVLAARKPVSLGEADKAAITTKAGGPGAQAFLDTGVDAAFSSPLSSRADAGFSVRRAPPRSSGAPPEGRAGSSAERTDAASLRKPDQGPAEARAPLATDAAASVLRGPMDAEAATAVFAVRPEAAEEARGEDADQAAASKGAAGAAKAAQGRAAPAEASPAQAPAKDAPPVLEAKADSRPGLVEAPGREKANDASVVMESKAADPARSATPEASGRAKATDAAASDTAEVDKDGGAAEAPLEAKAQDVASGAGHKPVKALGEAPARNAAAIESKADPGRGTVDVPGPTKAKDAPPAVEVKADLARDHAAAIEQPMTKGALAVPGVVSAQDQGSMHAAPLPVVAKAMTAPVPVAEPPAPPKAAPIPVADPSSGPIKATPIPAADPTSGPAKAAPIPAADTPSGPTKAAPIPAADTPSGPTKAAPIPAADTSSGPTKAEPTPIAAEPPASPKAAPIPAADPPSGPLKTPPISAADPTPGSLKADPLPGSGKAVPIASDPLPGPGEAAPIPAADPPGPTKAAPAPAADSPSGLAKAAPIPASDPLPDSGKAAPIASDPLSGPTKAAPIPTADQPGPTKAAPIPAVDPPGLTKVTPVPAADPPGPDKATPVVAADPPGPLKTVPVLAVDPLPDVGRAVSIPATDPSEAGKAATIPAVDPAGPTKAPPIPTADPPGPTKAAPVPAVDPPAGSGKAAPIPAADSSEAGKAAPIPAVDQPDPEKAAPIQIVADPPGSTKAAPIPAAPALDDAQQPVAPAPGMDAAGGAPVGSPVAEPSLHFPDLWPQDAKQPVPGQTYIFPVDGTGPEAAPGAPASGPTAVPPSGAAGGVPPVQAPGQELLIGAEHIREDAFTLLIPTIPGDVLPPLGGSVSGRDTLLDGVEPGIAPPGGSPVLPPFSDALML